MSNEPENRNYNGSEDAPQEYETDVPKTGSDADTSGEKPGKVQALGEEAAAAAEKTSWLRELYEWTQAIAIAVVLALLINQFLFALVQVEGASMEPTLHEKERLIVTKLFYKPKPRDIVIVKSSVLKKHIVKRVIAVAGQEINIDPQTGDVYVDGVLQNEPYIMEKINSSHIGAQQYPFTVPEGTVFVMGDNRNNSQDSRSIGVIPLSEIVGKASFRVTPFRKFGGLYENVPDAD